MKCAESRTKLHVCAIEALPGSSQFLCGAYELENTNCEVLDAPSRVGSLTLYDGGETLRQGLDHIVEVGSVPTDGGILDCKIARSQKESQF